VVLRRLSVFRLLCLSGYILRLLCLSGIGVKPDPRPRSAVRPTAGVGLARPTAAWFFCGSAGSIDFRVFFVFFHFDLLFMFSFWFFAIFLKMMMWLLFIRCCKTPLL
jgi:hypothetical protein